MVNLDSFDLDDAQRHAVVQTIAAEQLEGWQPTDDHIAGLVELLTGAKTFGEYLSPHLTDLGPAVRPRIFARRTPYFLPGTSVLRNNFRVCDSATLANLEFIATAGRILQIHLGQKSPGLDVCALHQHVFGDVYAWAGAVRFVELRRGGRAFGSSRLIEQALAPVANAVDAVARGGHGHDELCRRLAEIYADYNQIHPFRDGNGRTGTLLLHLLAARAGHRLHLDTVTRDDWIAASRESMPWDRDGKADPRPIMTVLNDCVRPVTR